MVSFREEIQKKRESLAYCQGMDSFRDDHTRVVSPYEKDTVADRDWLDGFYDAWYMRIITGGRYGS